MKIIHLSDLHFGTERPELIRLVQQDIATLKPNIIVVSGDLTQRARTDQYKKAKSFLQSIHIPVLCVPGNHDIPLYNLIARFGFPFYQYKKWISPSLCIHHNQENIAILGINSVTPYKAMGGYITDKQLQLVKEFFHEKLTEKIKIVIMHHNLISSERHKTINDADKIIDVFAQCKINLVLSGHIHAAHVELLKHKYNNNLYVVTAGTAISTRTTAPNSYNILDISGSQFKLIVRAFSGTQFMNVNENVFAF